MPAAKPTNTVVINKFLSLKYSCFSHNFMVKATGVVMKGSTLLNYR